MIKDTMRYRIISAAMEEINENGEDFTIDNVAKRAGISKKTIYNKFENKREVLFSVIESMFEKIENRRISIVNDAEMDIVEKIKELMYIMPDEFININFEQYGFIYNKYPDTIDYVKRCFEMEWNYLEEHLVIAMKLGRIKRTNLNTIKVVIMGTIYYYMTNEESFHVNDASIKEVVSIVLNGIRMK